MLNYVQSSAFGQSFASIKLEMSLLSFLKIVYNNHSMLFVPDSIRSMTAKLVLYSFY